MPLSLTKKDRALIYHQKVVGLLLLHHHGPIPGLLPKFNSFLTFLGETIVRKMSLRGLCSCPYMTFEFYDFYTDSFKFPKNFKFFVPMVSSIDA